MAVALAACLPQVQLQRQVIAGVDAGQQDVVVAHEVGVVGVPAVR